MTVTINLPEDQLAALTARAHAKGVSAEEYVRLVLAHDLENPSTRRHISEIIRENMRRVPPEEISAMPTDSASEHDHYIYGLPKRNR